MFALSKRLREGLSDADLQQRKLEKYRQE